MSKPRILITAANGHTGFPAAKELLNLGFDVRAMVRNPNGKGAKELKHIGADIFVGDKKDARIICEFDEFPDTLIIDTDYPTSDKRMAQISIALRNSEWYR